MRLLLLNPRSGGEEPSPARYAEAARRLGVELHVLTPGDDAAAIARQSGAEVIGMAGGDGSLGAVAAVAIERDVPFVCVPAGTRNHFARDVGLDRDDPLAAVGAFDGRERRVDVGLAGDLVFLNNVSLGTYADLVHRRERGRRRGESLARLRALARALRVRRRAELRIDGEPLSANIVLVANNSYEVGAFSLGERASLEEGRLHLYTATGPLPRHWDDRPCERLELESSVPTLQAAVDGEPHTLRLPLVCAVESLALRLLLPPDA